MSFSEQFRFKFPQLIEHCLNEYYQRVYLQGLGEVYREDPFAGFDSDNDLVEQQQQEEQGSENEQDSLPSLWGCTHFVQINNLRFASERFADMALEVEPLVPRHSNGEVMTFHILINREVVDRTMLEEVVDGALAEFDKFLAGHVRGGTSWMRLYSNLLFLKNYFHKMEQQWLSKEAYELLQKNDRYARAVAREHFAESNCFNEFGCYFCLTASE